MPSVGRGNVLRAISRAACIALCNVQLATAVLLATFAGKAVGAETAEEFASICMKIVNTVPASDGQLHFKQTFENGRCWGAFAAVQSLSRIKSAVDKPPLLGICAPAEITRRQLIKVFTDYLESHPESRKQEFSVVAVISLRREYPCRNSE